MFKPIPILLALFLSACAGSGLDVSPKEQLDRINITAQGLENAAKIFAFEGNVAGEQCARFAAKRKRDLDKLYAELPGPKERGPAEEFAIFHSAIELIKNVRSQNGPWNANCGALYAQVRDNAQSALRFARMLGALVL